MKESLPIFGFGWSILTWTAVMEFTRDIYKYSIDYPGSYVVCRSRQRPLICQSKQVTPRARTMWVCTKIRYVYILYIYIHSIYIYIPESTGKSSNIIWYISYYIIYKMYVYITDGNCEYVMILMSMQCVSSWPSLGPATESATPPPFRIHSQNLGRATGGHRATAAMLRQNPWFNPAESSSSRQNYQRLKCVCPRLASF